MTLFLTGNGQVLLLLAQLHYMFIFIRFTTFSLKQSKF